MRDKKTPYTTEVELRVQYTFSFSSTYTWK